MRYFKKSIYWICICILGMCGGCSKESPLQEIAENTVQEKEGISIGIAMASSQSSYLIELVSYMEDTAKETGVDYEILYAEWDAKVQEEQIYSFIEEQKDVIIMCPVDAKSLLEVLKEANSQGVSVIDLNMKVDAISSEYIDTYIGASSTEEGILSAELVAELLGDEGGNVGIIEGEPGSEPASYRTEAFLEELKQYPKIKVVGIACGSWDKNRSYACAWDLVKGNDELDLIYAHDSNMAMGAYKALKMLSVEDEIKLVSIGENTEYLEALSAGVIDGIVTQSAEYEGRTSIYSAINIAKGVDLRPWYKTPAEKLTRLNVMDYKAFNY